MELLLGGGIFGGLVLLVYCIIVSSTDHSTLEVPIVTNPTPMPEAPELPQDASSAHSVAIPVSVMNTYDTPQNAYHSVRVACDMFGLTLEEKNLICACIYQESQFRNTAVHENFVNGKVASTDWGLCQINDYWHVKKYPDFPSAEYIVNHPEDAVHFMLSAYKGGGLRQWVSYSSGAYERWLSTDSPMWAL